MRLKQDQDAQLLWRSCEEHKLAAGCSVYPYSGILLFMAPNFGAAELRILEARLWKADLFQTLPSLNNEGWI